MVAWGVRLESDEARFGSHASAVQEERERKTREAGFPYGPSGDAVDVDRTVVLWQREHFGVREHDRSLNETIDDESPVIEVKRVGRWRFLSGRQEPPRWALPWRKPWSTATVIGIGHDEILSFSVAGDIGKDQSYDYRGVRIKRRQ